MNPTRDDILLALQAIEVPGGGNLVSEDMIRALIVQDGDVRFVVEVPTADIAKVSEPMRAAAERAARSVPGVTRVQAVLTTPTAEKAPPSLKIGGHPKPQAGPMRIPGVRKVIAVGSGKGGVGKSTVSSNLAIALTRAGKRVGLLDGDIHAPNFKEGSDGTLKGGGGCRRFLRLRPFPKGGGEVQARSRPKGGEGR